MAAIAPSGSSSKLQVIRNAVAQANVGQVDWITVPTWAKYMKVFLNFTAHGGTSPLVDFKIHDPDPIARDDTYKTDFAQWNGITQLTDVGFVAIQIGPGLTGIADDDTAPFYSLNAPLSPVLGLALTLDRTTGNETYTYTLAVVFSK